MNVSLFLYPVRLAALGYIEYLSTASSNKKPPARASREAIFSLPPGNYRPAEYWLMAGLAADDVAERIPLLTLEAHAGRIASPE
jgi:hypothetical protein